MYSKCTLIEAIQKPDLFYDALERDQSLLKNRRLPPEVVGEFILALKSGLAFCAATDYPLEKIQILADGGDVKEKTGGYFLKAAAFAYEGFAYAGIMVADIVDWRTYHRGLGISPSIRYARIDFGPGVDQAVRKSIRPLIAEFGLRYEWPFIQLQ